MIVSWDSTRELLGPVSAMVDSSKCASGTSAVPKLLRLSPCTKIYDVNRNVSKMMDKRELQLPTGCAVRWFYNMIRASPDQYEAGTKTAL